jgi:hypothetical protein
MKKSLSLILLGACGLGSGGNSNVLDAEDAEAVVNAASEALQSAPTGMGLVAQIPSRQSQPPSGQQWMMDQLFPTAVASAGFCRDTATLSSCTVVDSKNVRTRTFDCSFGLRGATAEGDIRLEYSAASCAFTANNSEITRTVNLTLTSKRGRQIQISAASHQDYRGETLGGGQKLKRIGANQVELEILGVNRKVLGAGGNELINVSTRSLGSLKLATGSLLQDLKVSEGQFEVIHNRAKFVTTWTAKDLSWSSGCGCPKSGTLSAAMSGEKTGSLSIEFTDSCGLVKLIQDDQSETEVELDHCEQT